MGRMEAIQNEKKEASRRGGKYFIDSERLEQEWDIKGHKVQDGDNFLQIIPPVDENKYFGLRLFIHYGIGPNNSAFLCLAKHKNKPCPICEERERLQKAGADDEELRQLNAYPARYAFLVVDTSSKDSIKEGIKFWVAPNTVNEAILSLSEDARTKRVIDITDPKNGHDLFFKVKGKDKLRKYESFKLEEMTQLPDKLFDSINDMPDLEEFLIYHSYEEMEEELQGTKRKDEESRSRRGSEESSSRRSKEPDEEVRPRSRRSRDEEELPSAEDFERQRKRDEEPEKAPESRQERRSESTSEEDIGRRVRERLAQTESDEKKPADEEEDRPRNRRRR